MLHQFLKVGPLMEGATTSTYCLSMNTHAVQVVMAFEEEFSIEIPDSEADKILSTREAIDFIASHPQAK